MGVIRKKIVLLSTGDVNGAYEAMYNLTKLFEREGHQAVLLVKHKSKNDKAVVAYPSEKEKSIVGRVLERVANKLKKRPAVTYDPKYSFISTDETSKNISPGVILDRIGFVPDYIFSGMTNGFMNSTDLLGLQQKSGAQVYNITVDMNHFTGGCHFAWDCKGYIDGCTSACPAITSTGGKEQVPINFNAKYENAKKGNFKIISGSGWTVMQSRLSKIYRDQGDFPNVNSLIDTELMNAKHRGYAKKIFNLDPEKFYIMMGAQSAGDPRKGFVHLVEALKILERQCTPEEKNRIRVMIVARHVSDSFDHIPFEKEKIKYIQDYRLLSLLYQAADIYVNSSIEDSGPLMVSEALACGTPVVGFDMGVVTNMVDSGYNGYKAVLKDDADLAKGIQTILRLDPADYSVYSRNAVSRVKEFSSLEYAAKVFQELFSRN